MMRFFSSFFSRTNCGFFFILFTSFVFQNEVFAKEIVVDLDGISTPCDAMRKGFEEYWKMNDADAFGGHSLTIKGSAKLDFSDFLDMGSYKLCAGLGYHLFDEGYKLDESFEKVKLSGPIFFDNAVFLYDEKTQDKPVVIFQLGSFYNHGWYNDGKINRAGGINVGRAIEGNLSIFFTGRRDGGWVRGDVPMMPFAKDSTSPATTIAWFETGVNRIDMTRLSLTVEAQEKDSDNIGLIHQHSWGVRRGPIRIENLGVGMLFYGNSVGTVSNSYIHRNDYGILLGDFEIGGDVAPSPNCLLRNSDEVGNARSCERRNLSVFGLSIRDTVIEGNAYGNVVINDASRVEFNSVHMEMADEQHQKGHGILIGGGRCSSPGVSAVCADDGDCAKGTCKFPEEAVSHNIRFFGGLIGGDKYSNQWDGVVLGGNAKQRNGVEPSVFIESLIQSSDLDPAAQPINSCRAPGVSCELISCRSGANLIVDLSRAFYDDKASNTSFCN